MFQKGKKLFQISSVYKLQNKICTILFSSQGKSQNIFTKQKDTIIISTAICKKKKIFSLFFSCRLCYQLQIFWLPAIRASGLYMEEIPLRKIIHTHHSWKILWLHICSTELIQHCRLMNITIPCTWGLKAWSSSAQKI